MGSVWLTKTISKEFGQFGIRCNAVAFGFIETRLTQAKEAGASVKVGDKDVALGVPEQVRQMAAQVQERFPRLDVLVNNAGVFMKRRQLTPQGLEYTLVINHLAHFLLTHLLLDLLKHSAPARILNVSSNTHQWVTDVDFDNLQGERHYDGDDAYALSKLANIWFTVELAERLQGSGVTVNALHPGVINTKLLRTGFVAPGAEVSEGAETSVYLACAPQVEGVSGAYFVQKQRSGTSALSRDRELRQRFWQVSAALVGL